MNRLYPLVLEHSLPVVVRYGISACIMLVCAVLQVALQMQTGAPGYFLLLPGVFLCGLIFDRGSGIFAAVIAVAFGAYASYAGGFGLDFLTTNSLLAITAAGTATVAEFQRAELRRVMLADKTKAVLLQEMAHRTKNNLAILGGMIRLEARHGSPELASALEATARRLQVMAEVYDHLSVKQDSRSVNMRYFRTTSSRRSSSRWRRRGPSPSSGLWRLLPAAQPCARDRHDRKRACHQLLEVRLSGRKGRTRHGHAFEGGQDRAIGFGQRRRSGGWLRIGRRGVADWPASHAAARRRAHLRATGSRTVRPGARESSLVTTRALALAIAQVGTSGKAEAPPPRATSGQAVRRSRLLLRGRAARRVDQDTSSEPAILLVLAQHSRPEIVSTFEQFQGNLARAA